MSAPLIYLIAGEPSGDLLAGRLMLALRQLTGDAVRFAGIGGEMMREAGLTSLFPQSDLAVMGFAEVLPKIPLILRRLKQTLADIDRLQPSLVITIDSWGFTGRVAKALKAKESRIPRLHYVAPMVWAWKESRARQLADRVDRLLCLLPNEPAYFARHGLKAVHVGHSVLEQGGAGEAGADFRRAHAIDAGQKLLCILPGSRQSETSRLLPVFRDTALALQHTFPGLQLVIPTVETVAEDVARHCQGWPLSCHLVTGREKWAAFAAADAALAASGTVALELAMARRPMVIGYKIAPLSAWLLRRLIKVPYVCLINLLLDRAVVPELLQEACRPDRLAAALSPLLVDGPERRAQLEGCAAALMKLGVAGDAPSLRAAREALTMIKEPEK